MLIEIFDLNYRPIGDVQRIESLTWNREMYTSGEFTITCRGSVNSLFTVGRVIRYSSAVVHAGYIEQITITEDEEGLKTVIRGHDVLSLLNRRILATDWGWGGEPAAAIAEIVNREKRGLNVSISIDSTDHNAVFNYQHGTNLLDVVSDIATHYNILLSYELIPNIGIKITGSVADAISPGTLAVENGTLLSVEYDVSTATYKNVVYASNTDKDMPVTVVVGNASGDARREYAMSADVTEDIGGVLPDPRDYFPGTVTVQNVAGARNFTLNDAGLYHSSFPGATIYQDSISSMAKIVIDVTEPCEFGLYYRSTNATDEQIADEEFFVQDSPEVFFSKLDMEIPVERDGDTRPQSIWYADRLQAVHLDSVGWGELNHGYVDTIKYEVPAGTHYIYVKAQAHAYLGQVYNIGFKQGLLDVDRTKESLTQRGNAKNAELRQVDAITARINTNSQMMRYGREYDLGDYMQISSATFGVSAVTQITKVMETVDKSGENVSITFGQYYMTQRRTYDLGV